VRPDLWLLEPAHAIDTAEKRWIYRELFQKFGIEVPDALKE
jgi:carbamoylphosphate synthase large subunit